MSADRPSRYPGYDVLLKRDSPSWDDATREVIDARLAQPNRPHFCSDPEWRTLNALCLVIVPHSRGPIKAAGTGNAAQPGNPRWAEPSVPVAALVDMKLFHDGRDGYRDARLPPLREAWRIGLEALDAESRQMCNAAFADIGETRQRELVTRMQRGELQSAAWQGMPCQVFFSLRVLHDIGSAYFAHPQAWNEIGFGGPANPRGYVRMQANRRDTWDASEAKPGREAQALEENRRAR